MRVGIVSASNVNATLMKEELGNVIEDVTVFSINEIEAGNAKSSNQHILIYDIFDASIMDHEDLVEQMDSGEPVPLFNVADLYVLSPEERIAWRNKIVGEMKKLAPDLAAGIKTGAEKSAEKVDTLIIGSSSGGPLALKEFFSKLPKLRLTIFIAQHMPEEAFSILLRQVKDAAKSWDVMIGSHGLKIEPGKVIVVPRGVTMHITPNSVLEFRPNATEPEFHPSINQAIRSVYAYSKDRTNIMILTGMGEDGAAAVRDLKGRARLIIAQDAASSASASMPNATRDTGAVQRTGTPSELAHYLSESYGFGLQM